MAGSSDVDGNGTRDGDGDGDVLVVGGGPSGFAAGIFTARAGLETIIADRGDSILRRNAHLENFPGFPAGVDARLLLWLMREQAARAGADHRDAEVVRLDVDEDGFAARTAAGESLWARFVICATKNEVGYLEEVDGVTLVDRGKTFVETDRRGRTGVPGLYAAGRLAGKPHQAIVAAGNGAEVAVTLLEDADVPFYHDWVTPQRYFTGRDREVPPGCEEIDDEERERRVQRSMAAMTRHFSAPHPDAPEQHPSVEPVDE